MKGAAEAKGSPPLTGRERLFAAACGLWIGLSLLKFGNPIIFDGMIGTPGGLVEFLLTPWPIHWGYVLLGAVVLAAFPLFRFKMPVPSWPVLSLGFWLFWQFLSSARTIDSRLTNPALVHFVSCAISFLLGWGVLSRMRASAWFWWPVLACFSYALFAGFDQHAGGLEATRKAFYAQANWQLYPKEYLLKIESNRIFSTLVYPNAFAGVILLLMPAALWQLWTLTQRWPRVLRGVITGLAAYLSLACFYWTGSKGGWLIALIVAGAGTLQARIPRRWKVALVAAGLVLGLGAFFVRFSGYFQKGATSVGARFGYWKAAVQIAKDRPVLGSGPGTFSVLFKQLKPPEAEMARLVHNDYLEQASDSGLPGAIAFCAAIGGLLYFAFPKGRSFSLDLMIWLGLLGWALQAFIEFGLYIPALAWPMFLLLGALGRSHSWVEQER